MRKSIRSIFQRRIVSKSDIKSLKNNDEAQQAKEKWLKHHNKKNLTSYCPLCLFVVTKRPQDMKKHLKHFRCFYIDFDNEVIRYDKHDDMHEDKEKMDYMEIENIDASDYTIDVDEALYKLTNGRLKEQYGKCGTLATNLVVKLKVKNEIDEKFLEELGEISKHAKSKTDYKEESKHFSDNFASLVSQKSQKSEGDQRVLKIFESYTKVHMLAYSKHTVDNYTSSLFNSNSEKSFVNWIERNNYHPICQYFRNYGHESTTDDSPDPNIMRGPEDWTTWIMDTDENSPCTKERRILALKQLLHCMKYFAAEGHKAHLKNPSFEVYRTQIEARISQLTQLFRSAKKLRVQQGAERQRLRTSSVEELILEQSQLQKDYLKGLEEIFQKCDNSIPEQKDIHLAGCLLSLSLIPLNGNRMQAIQNQTIGDFNSKKENEFDKRLQLWEVTAKGKTPHSVYIQTSTEVVNLITGKYLPFVKKYLSHHKVKFDEYEEWRKFPLIIGGIKEGQVVKISSNHIYTTMTKKGYRFQTCQTFRKVVATVAKELNVPAEHLAHSEQVRSKDYYLNKKKKFEKDSVSIIGFFEEQGLKVPAEKSKIDEHIREKELLTRKEIDNLKRATVIATSGNTKKRKPSLLNLLIESILNLSSPIATQMALGLIDTASKTLFLKIIVLSNDELKSEMLKNFGCNSVDEKTFWKQALAWFLRSSRILDKENKFFRFRLDRYHKVLAQSSLYKSFIENQ